MEPTWSISRRKLGSIFGFRQGMLRQSTASFSSTKKRFMILLKNSWPVRFVMYATAYHFPKTDSFVTGGLNDFQVAISTLIWSRSSSMSFPVSDSSLMSQESESLSSKSVISLVSDPQSTTWVGTFRFKELAVATAGTMISFFVEWGSKKTYNYNFDSDLSPKLMIRFLQMILLPEIHCRKGILNI